MSIGDVVAGHAALVGTVSVGREVVRAWRSGRSGITVRVLYAMLGYTGAAIWTVNVKAGNRGKRPIDVNGVGLELQDGSGRTFVSPGPKLVDTIPGTVEPRHVANYFFEVEALGRAGFDLTRPLVGFVTLATGETIRSEPTTLPRG